MSGQRNDFRRGSGRAGLGWRAELAAQAGYGALLSEPSASRAAAAAKTQGRAGPSGTSGAARGGGAGIPAWAGPGWGRGPALSEGAAGRGRRSLSLGGRRTERASRCRPRAFGAPWASGRTNTDPAPSPASTSTASRRRGSATWSVRHGLCSALLGPPRSGGLPATLCPRPRRPPRPLSPLLLAARIPRGRHCAWIRGKTLLCGWPSTRTNCSEWPWSLRHWR